MQTHIQVLYSRMMDLKHICIRQPTELTFLTTRLRVLEGAAELVVN